MQCAPLEARARTFAHVFGLSQQNTNRKVNSTKVATDMEKHSIYEQLLEHCPPYQLGGPFDFLKPDASAYNCPEDPQAVICTLKETFSSADLVSAGIARESGENKPGPLQPSPSLCADGPIMALRDEHGRAFDVVTDDGCLSGTRLPVLAVARDSQLLSRLADFENTLFVCSSMADAIVLTSLGLPATIGAGLASLSVQQFIELCDLMNLERPRMRSTLRDTDASCEEFESSPHGDRTDTSRVNLAPANADECSLMNGDRPPLAEMRNDTSMLHVESGSSPLGDRTEEATDGLGAKNADDRDRMKVFRPPLSRDASLKAENPTLQLAFVEWSPSRLDSDVPDWPRPIVDRLEKVMAVVYQNPVPYDLYAWKPRTTEIARLKSAADERCEELTRDALICSLDRSMGTYLPPEPKVPTALAPPKNYASALAELRQLRHSHTMTEDQRQKALRAFEEQLDRQVVRPLVDAALATEDPVKRNRLLLLAQFSGMFHMEAIKVSENISRPTDGSGAGPEDGLSAAQFKRLLALADRIIKLSHEDAQCKSMSTITTIEFMESRPSPPMRPPALIDSD